MKKTLLLLLLFIFCKSFAQLDREHWFAPMFDGQSNDSGYEQFLHLSTNESTAFTVTVYNNNAVIAQRTIKKGSPAIIQISRDLIITKRAADLMRVKSMGLYVSAERPCFANLRFGVTNHAEIITSKGTAGIGTEFYTVVAPNLQNNRILGFAASFLATEDNTTVTVDRFKKNLFFNNGGALSSITFTLNKGQSYIIDGRADISGNEDGFIGATVTATKPVSMSNGNFNGQYASYASADGSDILMDQSVPVDKLGDEFVIVKGFGLIGNNMEGAVVVATEKNTAVYLNDSATPYATLVDEGDHIVIPETMYVNRGQDHYNMHLKTDKNVYVYQLLAGVAQDNSPLATGGMNYIPPLNCYLPQKIDEISHINKISPSDSDYRFKTKLNIITEKGATVRVNGVIPPATSGPFDISNLPAGQTWVSYSIPDVMGNVTIESDRAVTAGIASGNGAVGYGGYFAGFSSVPLITKTLGDCLPGVKLAVTAGFDSYLWLEKVGGAYVAAPGVNNTFEYLPTRAGIYAVKLKQGTCDEIQTRDFKFYNCTTYTNFDYEICTATTITPNFALSSQTVDVSTVKILTPPTKGNAVVNPDGTLTYTANPNATGTDTFQFSFCGNGALPDCETVQATLQLNQIEKYDAELFACSAGATGVFDLTAAAMSPQPNLTIKYFRNSDFTDQIPDDQLTAYAAAPGFVYVQLTNSFGCTASASIELKLQAPPVMDPSLYTIKHCDEDVDGIIDGVYRVDLQNLIPIILQNAAGYTVRFYKNQSEAEAGLSNTVTGTFTFTADTSVWVRVDSPAACPPAIRKIDLKTGAKVPLLTTTVNQIICDTNGDQTENIDLSAFTSVFGTADSATYFASLPEAEKGENPVDKDQTITSDRTYFYRLTRDGFCEAIGTMNFMLTAGTPSAVLQPNYTVCENDSIILDVGPNFQPAQILWSTGENSQTISVGAGNYFVDLTNEHGCIYRQFVTVSAAPRPQLNISNYDATHCDDDFDGSIEVDLSDVTPVILSNASLFTVRYYSSQAAADAGGNNNLPDTFSYSADTSVYVRVDSPHCPFVTGVIKFKKGKDLPLLTTSFSAKVCDNDFDGIKDIDLSDFSANFTTDTPFAVDYYLSLDAAQAMTQPLGTSSVSVDNSGTFYLRFQKAGFCDVIGTLKITVQKAKKSAQLTDREICPEKTTMLDAGPGFDGYLWSTGETTQSIEVAVGDYFVDLLSEGCTYRQEVSVKAVEVPQISSVGIAGSTVTVNVNGGKAPYQYALDDGPFQTSNIFTNVRGGTHTVSVISADLCAPVIAVINVIELFNVLTPNGDGVNDVINYSQLLLKEEPFMKIFDRYGTVLFTGDAGNRYTWDGKISGRAVATGSYWFVMKWKEAGAAAMTEYSGWILVKNRD